MTDDEHVDRFGQQDIRETAAGMLDALLARLEAAGTPERIAENDYLMKCACFLPFLIFFLVLIILSNFRPAV